MTSSISRRSVAAGLLLTPLAITVARAADGEGDVLDARHVLEEASITVDRVRREMKSEEFDSMMRRAKGVLVIPSYYKAGFIIGGAYGDGILATRQPEGGFGDPEKVGVAAGFVAHAAFRQHPLFADLGEFLDLHLAGRFTAGVMADRLDEHAVDAVDGEGHLGGFTSGLVRHLVDVHRTTATLGRHIGRLRPVGEGHLQVEGRDEQSFGERYERRAVIEFFRRRAFEREPDAAFGR